MMIGGMKSPPDSGQGVEVSHGMEHKASVATGDSLAQDQKTSTEGASVPGGGSTGQAGSAGDTVKSDATRQMDHHPEGGAGHLSNLCGDVLSVKEESTAAYQASSSDAVESSGSSSVAGAAASLSHKARTLSQQPAPSPAPAPAASTHTSVSVENIQGDSPSLSGSGGTRSRYGRKTAVTNFARLLDPMSRSNSPSADVAKEPPMRIQHGSEDPQSSSMVEAVRALVYKVGAPSASIAAAAVNPHSDKYIGVRNKQSGFGAVIKKNHSEINLGIYETAEEAARAYDMAALFCQGDRAKVNFSDSLDLYDNHYTLEVKIPVIPVRDKDFYTMAFLGPNALPRAAGRLLTELADRLPYSAVRCGDSNVWEEFANKNDSLETWGSFGGQLLWLLKHQIVEEVLSDSWRGVTMMNWETSCLTCSTGADAAKIMQEAEQTGVNWDKVGGMWDAEGVTEGVSGQGRTRAAVRHGAFANARVPFSLGGTSLAGRDKRKRDIAEDGALDGSSADPISDFGRINMHLISLTGNDVPASSDGLAASLDVIRAQRKQQRIHAAAQAAQADAKREQMLQQQLARGAASQQTSPLAQRDSSIKTDRSSHNNRPASSQNASVELIAKSIKGMACRFCGKAFTHAPAHLQHERAHVQQQETMNPSSRIYQHMLSSPATLRSCSEFSAKLDPCMDSRPRTSASRFLDSLGQDTPVTKPRQASMYILELASRLPAAASSLDYEAWGKWGLKMASSDTLQQVCDQMEWLASRLEKTVTQPTWTDAAKVIWRSECEGCDSAAELMKLVSRFEREALDWSYIEQLPQQARLINIKQISILSESIASGPDQAQAIHAPVEAALEFPPASCVESGIPCGMCSNQNKGIAACFAQGHLFVVDGGAMPSSCKDCKQRNKGALFCFKRGHMHNLVPVLRANGSVGGFKEGESSDSGEEVVLR